MLFEPIFLPTRIDWFDLELKVLILERFSEVVLKECPISSMRRYEMYYNDTLIAELDARPVQSERLAVQFNMNRSEWFRIADDGTVIQIPKVCSAFFHHVAQTWPDTLIPSYFSICAAGVAQDTYEYYANMPPLENPEEEERRQYLAAFAFQRLPSVYLSQVTNAVVAQDEETPAWQKIPDHAWDQTALKLLYKGHAITQIAKQLDVTEKTVRNRLSKLREAYGSDIVPFVKDIKRGIYRDNTG